MSTKNNRSVVPDSKGGWKVVAANAQRASATTGTQAKAVERAREIVRNAGGGEVRIHGKNGQIRDSDTVPRGNDPNPPKDRR